MYGLTGALGGSIGVRVRMTDKAVIDWLQTQCPGNVRFYDEKRRNWKPTWAWSLQRQADLVILLPAIIPVLICKKAEAEALLVLVQHMAAKPVYDVPTGNLSRPRRAERRVIRASWTERALELKAAVRAAR